MSKKVNAQHILVKNQDQANEILVELNNGKKFEELDVEHLEKNVIRKV